MGESRCRSWDGIGRVHLNPTPVCVMPPPQTHTCPHACAPPQPTPAFPSLRKQPRGCLLLLPLSFASFPLKAVPLLPAYSRPAAAHAPPFSPHLSFTSWSQSSSPFFHLQHQGVKETQPPGSAPRPVRAPRQLSPRLSTLTPCTPRLLQLLQAVPLPPCASLHSP